MREKSNVQAEEILYGQLVILGYNGEREPNHVSQRQTTIALRKRVVANGVKPGPLKRVFDAHDSGVVRNRSIHSVSYTLSRHETVVVEYVPDPTTDMFQVGRSTSRHIDFVISNPLPGSDQSSRPTKASGIESFGVASNCMQDFELKPNGTPFVANSNLDKHNNRVNRNDWSTTPIGAVSRFACRICVERDPPHTARIYAAGFDESNNIVLGEMAVKWTNCGQMDGLTTNGVLIHRCDPEQLVNNTPGIVKTEATANCRESVSLSNWREVSICGSVYQMRNKRCVPTKDHLVNEDNVLRDMTLIDLCGVTLLWRSATGLEQSASAHDLKLMVDGLNRARFQCPILFKTLRIPPVREVDNRLSCITQEFSTSDQAMTPSNVSEPYVYLDCGHVHGWHPWRAYGDVSASVRTCPMCRQPSLFVPLKMGLEYMCHVDRSLPTHCFNPCGHMASEKTCRYWCAIPLPSNQDFSLFAKCPFCLTAIKSAPVQLRFNSYEDEDVWSTQLSAQLAEMTCEQTKSMEDKSPPHTSRSRRSSTSGSQCVLP